MRLTEIYPSVQGEGPHVGQTTIFTRFAGCNLRCPGWPCDTPFAIDPAQYRDQWYELSSEALADQIHEKAESVGAKNITLTGGEPFLQHEEDLHKLTHLLRGFGYSIDCFSNGTILYPDWAVENISFIMDWKLPGSGEEPNKFGFANDTRVFNLYRLDQASIWHSIKFVIKNRMDYDVAKELYYTFKDQMDAVHVYYSAVWDKIETKEIVQWVMDDKLPWLMNVQVHNYVWPANERGR